MDLLALLQANGVAAKPGTGSKSSSGAGAGGFEQLLLGLIGQHAPTQAGQLPSTTVGKAAAAIAATQAVLPGGAAGQSAGVPTVTSLVEAGRAVGSALSSAEVILPAKGPDNAPAETGKSVGAISQALLDKGLSGAAPQPQGAATPTVVPKAPGASGITVVPTPAAQPASIKAGPAATPNAHPNTGAPNGTPNGTPSGTPQANVPAPGAIVAGAPSGGTDGGAKPDGTAASLIAGSAEVAQAKSTIQAAVINPPGAEAAKAGSENANGKGKGKAGAAASKAGNARKTRGAAPSPNTAAAPPAQRPDAGPSAGAVAPKAPSAEAVGGPGGGANAPTDTAPSQPLSTAVPIGGGEPVSQAPGAARAAATPYTPASEQVALQFGRALADGTNHITIRLQPESLGRVDVQVELSKDGRLTAVFIADRPETLDMLQRDARLLERALNDAGLRTDTSDLSFNLRGEGRELGQFARDAAGHDGAGSDEADDGSVEGDGEGTHRRLALNVDALLDIQV